MEQFPPPKTSAFYFGQAAVGDEDNIHGDIPHIPEDFQSDAPASAVSTDPIKPADFRKCGLM